MKVLVCTDGDRAAEHHLHHLGSHMPADRQARWQRIRDAWTARATVLGYWLVRVGLDRAGGGTDPGRDWVIGYRGKPSLASGPHFSLAHSGSVVACAIADEPVGFDVERIDERVVDATDVVFGARERACVGSALDPMDEATRLWVMKESYVKRSGEGLSDAAVGIDVTVPMPDTRFHTWRSGGHWLAVCSQRVDGVRVDDMSVDDLLAASHRLIDRMS